MSRGYSKFVYPRTISIYRPFPQTSVGVGPYGGKTDQHETLVFSGIQCAIQQRRGSRVNETKLPSDPPDASSQHYIFVPKFDVTLGDILREDVCVDDIGMRYMVVFPYWNSFNYRLDVRILDT